MLRLLHKGSKIKYNVRYSRQYFEDLAIDREAIKREEARVKQEQRLKAIYNLPSNTKNSNNFIKVKINHDLFQVNPIANYQRTSCWVLEPKKIQIYPKVTMHASRRYIITSIKKAKAALIHIKKMHILDAINFLQRSHKKVAKLMVRTFYNAVDHAKNKGLNPLRLWIHGCLIGKKQRYRGVRYHAKGRGARQKRDFCQVKVIFFEKPEKQFYQQIGTGKCCPAVANFIRFCLKTQQANYETLAKFTGMTTSKGRQQARQILKRKIYKVMLQNEKNNIYVPKKVIEEKLIEEAGKKAQQKMKSISNQQYTPIKLREKMYKKNMQKQQ